MPKNHLIPNLMKIPYILLIMLSVFNIAQAQSTNNSAIEDWRNIVFALRSYVISEEERLIRENAGDAEWGKLSSFITLASDINLYVLGGKE